ncbi:MAG TPA: hypothetical protein VER55_10910, partial [Ardenticatenaceae bacterium]|nr:hypothetical protein [Ardenticatenaceae bacterium]
MQSSSDFSRYLNIRASVGGSLRYDGGRLAFLNDTSGTFQVWTTDGPGRWPQQLTFYRNRVTFVSYSPTSSDLIFGMDEGGNEQDQLYLMDDQGLGLRALTDTPEAKHVWGGWSHDGRQIAFTATRDDPAEFYPYVMELASGEIRCVARLPGYNHVAAWMPDDDALIVGRLSSLLDSDLFYVDLKTGEIRHLTPHEGDVRYLAVEPLHDGSGLFLVTDEGRDFLNLAFYDFASHRVHLVAEHPWDQEELALTKDGHWLALLSNEDGYGVLEIRDLVNETRTKVEGLPRGVLAGLRAGRDGRTVLLTATSATQTYNVWAVDAASGAATRWTESTLGTVSPLALVEPELIHYPSFDGRLIPALYF